MSQPEKLGSSPGVFPLRVKYAKVTVLVPVAPKTNLVDLKRDVLGALSSVGETPPASTGKTSFGDFDVTDIGLFTGAPHPAASEGGGPDDELVFIRAGKGTDDDKTTVSDIGWVDESNNIAYLGFSSQDGQQISHPQVQVASLADEVPDYDLEDIPAPRLDEFGNEM